MRPFLIIAKRATASLFIFLLCNSCQSPEQRVAKVAKSYTVHIKQMQFQPADLTVHLGDTVVFVNEDVLAHDVTEEKTKAWSSGPMNGGDKWSFTPSDSADYYCSIHVVMKGKIRVVQ